MTTGIRLVPLKCIQCAAPLPAQVDEVAWRCELCGTGQMLGEAGLQPLEILFAAKQSDASWQPFWAFNGVVKVTRRQTQGGRSQGFDWSKVQRFWLPAYTLDLKRAQAIAIQLTRSQPAYTPVAQPAGLTIAGCSVLPGDARQLAEFVVLSLEAGQPDWLRDIDFALELGQPVLWMLPVRA